jgi:hypothetical protein
MDPQASIFDDESKQLEDLKQSILTKFQKSGMENSASAVNAIRNSNMFMDTAYLWLRMLEGIIMMGGPREVTDDDMNPDNVIKFPQGATNGGEEKGTN